MPLASNWSYAAIKIMPRVKALDKTYSTSYSFPTCTALTTPLSTHPENPSSNPPLESREILNSAHRKTNATYTASSCQLSGKLDQVELTVNSMLPVNCFEQQLKMFSFKMFAIKEKLFMDN